VGVLGNETADLAAKEAAAITSTCEYPAEHSDAVTGGHIVIGAIIVIVIVIATTVFIVLSS